MSPFTKTLCVGAAAAVSLPLTVLALGGRMGPNQALALHAVVTTASYLACLAQGPRKSVAIFAVAAVFGGAAWVTSASLSSLLVMLGLLIAGVRSGWLFQRSTARALATEAGVLAVALAIASFLYQPGLLGAALVTWGWFVAQSFYFLLEGWQPRSRGQRMDPFNEAADSLEDLLEATP
jgi:hypothetical protein